MHLNHVMSIVFQPFELYVKLFSRLMGSLCTGVHFTQDYACLVIRDSLEDIPSNHWLLNMALGTMDLVTRFLTSNSLEASSGCSISKNSRNRFHQSLVVSVAISTTQSSHSGNVYSRGISISFQSLWYCEFHPSRWRGRLPNRPMSLPLYLWLVKRGLFSPLKCASYFCARLWKGISSPFLCCTPYEIV